MYNEQEIREQLNHYLKLGLSPIWLKGKVANYHWKEFQLTEDNVKQYLKPSINWGIRSGLLPSGRYLWFLDLDSKDLLAEALEAKPELLDAPLVSTGRGFHVYLTWTAEVKTRHFDGIDVIGNGYVVCPPSIHQSGKPYRFIKPLDSLPPMFDPETMVFAQDTPQPIGHVPMVQVPLAQVPLYTSERNCSFPGVKHGQRHSALVRIIGILLNTHFREEETLDEALIWNRTNTPPMSEREVVTTVRNCYERWDVYIPPVKPKDTDDNGY